MASDFFRVLTIFVAAALMSAFLNWHDLICFTVAYIVVTFLWRYVEMFMVATILLEGKIFDSLKNFFKGIFKH